MANRNVIKVNCKERFFPRENPGKYEVYRQGIDGWVSPPSVMNIRQISSLVNGSPIEQKTYLGFGEYQIRTQKGKEFFIAEEAVEDLRIYRESLERKKREMERSEFELIP